MRIVKCILIIIMVMFFVPNVYASEMTLSAKADNTNVTPGSEVTVTINMKIDEIVLECLFSIENDESLEYVTMRGLNNWSYFGSISNFSLSNSDMYNNPFINGVNILEIKYRVNNAGKLVFKTQECSSLNENVYTPEDVSINFTIKENNTPKPVPPKEEKPSDGENQNKDVGKLVNIILSEGEINFNPDVYEYEVTVTNFEELKVDVNIDDEGLMHTINKSEDDKKIIISLFTSTGDETNYVINVIETIEEPDIDNDNDNDIEEKFNFVPIFIGIICLLVLINVFRIIKKLKK